VQAGQGAKWIPEKPRANIRSAPTIPVGVPVDFSNSFLDWRRNMTSNTKKIG